MWIGKQVVFAALLSFAVLQGATYRNDSAEVRVEIRSTDADALRQAAGFGASVDVDGRKSGSGVCVYQDKSDALVLTASHVIGEGKAFDVQVEMDGKKRPAILLWRDDKIDLAILRTAPMFAGAAEMVMRDIGHRHARVLVYGYPADCAPDGHGTFGHLASENHDVGGIPHGRTTAPVFYGNSGGAVYVLEDDGKWRLYGVMLKLYTSPYGIATHLTLTAVPKNVRAAIKAGMEARRGK